MTVVAPRLRRRLCGVAAAALTGALLTAPTVPAHAASTTVLINEVYGGGGNAGASHRNDFVELTNVSGDPIDLADWEVEYVSSSGTSGGTTPLTGTIAPGDTYLLQLASGGSAGDPLPAPDATGTLSMSGTNGSVRLTDGDTVVDLVGYGDAVVHETAPAPRLTNQTAAARGTGTDTDDNSADFAQEKPTPGAKNPTPQPAPSPVCGDPATRIHTVQGSGADSPMAGQHVAVEGQVTGVKPGLDGYFVQEEPSEMDDDPATSEGIFVFDQASTPQVGDHVRVVGEAKEYYGLTEIDGSDFARCGTLPAQAPRNVQLPADSLERYEGMDIRLTDDLVLSEYYNFQRYGEVVLGKPRQGEDRLWQPTQVMEPGPDAVALAQEYEKRSITIDDNSGQQNPATLVNPLDGEPFSLQNSFRGGDRVQGISGNLTYTFDAYKLQPNEYGTATRTPRPDTPTSPEGTDVRIASANVLNYFVTLDQGDPTCGPDRSMECRGANTPEEFARQQDKIVSEIGEMDADVVGVMEIENTQGVDAVGNLVDALNEEYGQGTYAAVDTGVIGTDAIKVGLIYQPGEVTTRGKYDILDSQDDERFNDDLNRVLLTQSFTDRGTKGVFGVSVAHLKSKGSSCEDVGDPDAGDGQGNCNQTRTDAVNAIVDHLRSDPTGSGDPDHVVVGDLNAYGEEDPVTTFEANDYTDLAQKFHGEKNYSYVFDGLVGSLDHAMTNASMTRQVLDVQEWHNNADEPGVLDYDMTYKPDSVDEIFAPDAYRSSDHDPLVVSLKVDAPDTVASTTTATVTPRRVTAGGDVTVSGHVADADGLPVDNARVTLQSAPTGAETWRDLTSRTTGPAGRFRFTATPRRTLRYRVLFRGSATIDRSASDPARVIVAPRITLRAPGSVTLRDTATFRGRVHPARRQPLRLERRGTHGWVRVDRARVRLDGRYTLDWTPRRRAVLGRQAFRVVTPAWSGFGRGTSPRVVVRVVR